MTMLGKRAIAMPGTVRAIGDDAGPDCACDPAGHRDAGSVRARSIAERCLVLPEFDPLQDLAARGDTDDRVPARGDPDPALGVQADAVRGETVGEDPPAR